MIFIETPIFTEDLLSLLSDDEYSEFQKYLANNPLAGEVSELLVAKANELPILSGHFRRCCSFLF